MNAITTSKLARHEAMLEGQRADLVQAEANGQITRAMNLRSMIAANATMIANVKMRSEANTCRQCDYGDVVWQGLCNNCLSRGG